MAAVPRILIIVQNLPVPLDRRVWLECQALTAAGYRVSVICPKGPGDPSRQDIDGVAIFKYAPPPAASGALGYLVEFFYCWLRTALLSLRVLLTRGFDVIQACNPPDTYWALALPYKLFGKKFVYDQHDLNPEVFRSRFGEPRGLVARLQYRMLLWLERRTYRTAEHVITTNESYSRIAMRRGAVPAERITVVRSGPDTRRMSPVVGEPALRGGRTHLLVYLGIMGPQDGVDIVLRVLDVLVREHGRRDVHAALLGFGDTFDELVRLAHELGLDDYVTFTGRVGPAEIARYLSTASIGVSPDPLNPLNDVSTMNKTMEYMSFALPVVAFDLAETRVTGGDAVEYVTAAPEASDVAAREAAVRRFADAVAVLLDDPQRRSRMALAGRRRAEQVLDWRPQRAAYVGAYDALTGHLSPALGGEDAGPEPVPSQGRLIDVTNDAAVLAFGADRGADGPS